MIFIERLRPEVKIEQRMGAPLAHTMIGNDVHRSSDLCRFIFNLLIVFCLFIFRRSIGRQPLLGMEPSLEVDRILI